MEYVGDEVTVECEQWSTDLSSAHRLENGVRQTVEGVKVTRLLICRDRVANNAGILTPCIWLFAQLFYRHRQRRWRQLVKGGFTYVA